MKKTQYPKGWLTSEKARKELKISSCDLAHLRVAGKLPYKKHGNTYFYEEVSVQRLRKEKISSLS